MLCHLYLGPHLIGINDKGMNGVIVSLTTKLMNRFQKFNHHRTTEVFGIAYPKTGSTWTRFLIGHYLQLLCSSEKMPLFDSYDRFGRCERACVGPAMQFTHMPLTWNEQTATDLTFNSAVQPFVKKKVLLIVRHPLDALVSHWFQFRYQIGNYDGDLIDFLEHPVYGLEKCFRFYNLWAERKDAVAGIMPLRYEDLRVDTARHFKVLLEFLGVKPDEQLINQAIEYASFKNMRKIEKSGQVPRYRSSGLKVFATGDVKNPDSYHVRKGKVGGYKEYLSTEMIAHYEARVVTEMGPWYGYNGH